MEFYISGRRSGKTAMLVEWFCEDPQGRVILVTDRDRAEYLLRRIAEKLQMSPRHFDRNVVTHAALDHGGKLRGFRGIIGIDDVDALLKLLVSPNSVGLVTGTGTKVKPDNDSEA